MQSPTATAASTIHCSHFTLLSLSPSILSFHLPPPPLFTSLPPPPPPREQVKARDQSSERSGYLFIKGKRGGWKRRWFVLSNLALYSFAKHEDRAAKESIIVPSHKLVYPFEVWCGRVGGG